MDVKLGLRLILRRAMLRRHERWPRERIERYQAERLQQLREFALARSPFYRSFHKGMESRELSEIPVLTKRQIMDAYDDFVTDPAIKLDDVRNHITSGPAGELFRGRYHACATSGTSGEPGIFLYNSSEWAWVLTSYARANRWAGIPSGFFHQIRLALVGSPKPWHQSGAAVESLDSLWVPSLILSATDPVADICRELNLWKPRLLITYSAMAGMLAEEQLAGRLDISPRAIMCVAEPLTKRVREQVWQTWKTIPFENYATTETACIAAECRQHSGLHLFEDLLITEVVDEENRPVPPGTMGAKLLVSVLFSRTLPLIRYELDDATNLTIDHCECGLPFIRLKKIGGRIAETLRIERPDNSVTILHATHFEDAIGLTDVRCWQVFRERNQLRVLLHAPVSVETRRQVKSNLQRLLEMQGIKQLPVALEIVDHIERASSGKMILVQDNTA